MICLHRSQKEAQNKQKWLANLLWFFKFYQSNKALGGPNVIMASFSKLIRCSSLGGLSQATLNQQCNFNQFLFVNTHCSCITPSQKRSNIGRDKGETHEHRCLDPWCRDLDAWRRTACIVHSYDRRYCGGNYHIHHH